METELNEKKEKLKKKLIYLKHKMAKFFDCDNNYIKFSDPFYADEKSKINAEIMLIDREASSLRKFNASTYYFNFEVEYIKREGIRYEENFYGYENLSEFFKKVSAEIEKLR